MPLAHLSAHFIASADNQASLFEVARVKDLSFALTEDAYSDGWC